VPTTIPVTPTPTATEQPMVVNFTENVTAGQSPLAVQFNESTTGSIQYYLWQFGDGATSLDQNPVHVYDTVGTYNVSLYIIGLTETQVKTVEHCITVAAPGTLTPTISPNVTTPTSTATTITPTTTVTPLPTSTGKDLPVANFVVTYQSGAGSMGILVTDATTNATSVKYDLGDGTTTAYKNFKYTYWQPGTYTITLIATNDAGSSERTITVTVPAGSPTTTTVSPTVTLTTVSPTATLTLPVTPTVTQTPVNPNLPVANFVVTYQAGAGSMEIHVTDASTNATTVKYDLGDGTATAYKNFKYTYWQPGTYTITLIATNDAGSSTKTVAVTVPSGSPTITTTTATITPTVTVTTSAPTATTVSPTTTMTVPVTPTVTQTPVNPNLPVANFTVTFPSGVGTMDIQVTNTAVNATSVRYDLGDGATTTYPNFTYTYWRPGTYTINQTATNAAGSSNRTITVTVPAVATPTQTATAVAPTVTVTGNQYNGPHTIPGTLQAEDYDLGGEGVAYHDTTAGNLGGVYRHDDVDIEQLDTDGSPNVGWIRAGEWMAYTVNVSTAGTYDAGFRVASSHAGSTVQVYVDDGTTPVATVSVPNTGAWPVFQTVSALVTLPAGQHRLVLKFPTDYVNINWITFALRG
jgi:PKD repeat protein